MNRCAVRYGSSLSPIVLCLSSIKTFSLIWQAMVDVAREVGADAVSHGCTGKGNDQVRCFEFGGLL